MTIQSMRQIRIAGSLIILFSLASLGAMLTQPSSSDIDKTSDGRWYYRITSYDAGRFGGNRPSDLISANICGPRKKQIDLDNGAGGRLKMSFRGDFAYCDGMVKAAEDWQKNTNNSWWLYHDIIIYGSQNPSEEKATLSF